MKQLAIFGGVPERTKSFPSWPVFNESEINAVAAVLRSGKWWRNSLGEGAGVRAEGEDRQRSKVGEFQEAFALCHEARYGLACASGTAALEISLKAAGIGPGDEVIVPPYTFIATATAPLTIGAAPVFCDIDPDTFNLDPGCLKRVITSKTRAVIPVHFAGMPADMEGVLAIARDRGLRVIEDAAHAHGASWNGRMIGALGDAGTFSFQGSKNMTAGEGGIILTNNAGLARLCESLIWAGREPGRPWYEHHRLGWNHRLTEFQAAILIEQLKRLERQTAQRTANGLFLNRHLSAIPGILPLSIPSFVTRHVFHLYVFRFDEEAFGVSRADFVSALQGEGIPCSSGYPYPLYRNPMFLHRNFYGNGNTDHFGGNSIDYGAFSEICPRAEEACRRAVWIEHRALLADEEDIRDIVRAVEKIYECRAQFLGKKVCSSQIALNSH